MDDKKPTVKDAHESHDFSANLALYKRFDVSA